MPKVPSRSTGSISTRSPTCHCVTPSPTAQIVPAMSEPTTTGSFSVIPGIPRRVKISWKFTEQAAISTTTSPLLGSGSG
jgi:hypothetical protein